MPHHALVFGVCDNLAGNQLAHQCVIANGDVLVGIALEDYVGRDLGVVAIGDTSVFALKLSNEAVGP